MWVFGIPDISNYLNRTFAEPMRVNGVEKIPVVINEETFSMLAGIFQGNELNHLQSAQQIRFFGSRQFYESFDSVSKFQGFKQFHVP